MVLEFVFNHLGLLISFLLGSSFTIFFTKWQQHNESKKLRTLYLNWFNNSKEGIYSQLDYLVKYAETLKNGDYATTTYNINNLQLDKLISISDVSLFQAFVFDKKGSTSKNSQRLFKMVSNVNYIVIALSDVKAKFDDTRLDLKNWQEKWNTLIIEFHEDLASYVFSYQENYGDNVERIIDIKKTLKVMEPLSIKSNDFIHTVLEPCEKVLLNQIHLDTNDVFLHKFLSKIQRIKILEIEKKEKLKRTSELMSNYVSQIKKTLEENEENISYFSN